MPFMVLNRELLSALVLIEMAPIKSSSVSVTVGAS